MRDHRWTVALLVPLVGVVGYAVGLGLERGSELGHGLGSGTGPRPEPGLGPALTSALMAAPIVILANGVMALPLAVGLRPFVGRRGLVALAVLAGFSWAIEAVGVLTGWPYGRFRYAIGLEPLLFGLVPVALPLFWVPMVLNAWLLALRAEAGLADRIGATARIGAPSRTRAPSRIRATARIGAAVGMLVVLDVIMDPGAVALGFWAWDEPGPWYGVPWINFGGWALSGGVAMGVLAWGLDAERLRRSAEDDGLIWGTLVAFLAFWGPINALHGQWAPALLAAGLATFVLPWYADKRTDLDANDRFSDTR